MNNYFRQHDVKSYIKRGAYKYLEYYNELDEEQTKPVNSIFVNNATNNNIYDEK